METIPGNTSYEDQTFQRRFFAASLFPPPRQVFIEWLYIYIILEFQSGNDPYMSIRILAYVALLYQDLVRSKQLTRSGKLPPVLPIVLYNGEPRWQAATQVFDLIENIPSWSR